jgi:hypothetical protein
VYSDVTIFLKRDYSRLVVPSFPTTLPFASSFSSSTTFSSSARMDFISTAAKMKAPYAPSPFQLALALAVAKSKPTGLSVRGERRSYTNRSSH